MLKKFGIVNCEVVVQCLVEVDNKKFIRDELKEKFEFVKECKVWILLIICLLSFFVLCLIYNKIFWGFQSKIFGMLIFDDFLEVGNVLCGIDLVVLDRMDVDVFEKMVLNFQKCNFDFMIRKKIVINIVSKMLL